MAKSCLDGYLTEACAKCDYWHDGSDDYIGCGCPFPIMYCEAFVDMYNREEGIEEAHNEW